MVATDWKDIGLEILDDSDFSGSRLKRGGRYIVCFGATWCPVTRRFMPNFVAEQGKLSGTLAIADITSYDSSLWDDFRIRITPSVIVFQEGEVHFRIDGRRWIGVSRSALAQLEDAYRRS